MNNFNIITVTLTLSLNQGETVRLSQLYIHIKFMHLHWSATEKEIVFLQEFGNSSFQALKNKIPVLTKCENRQKIPKGVVPYTPDLITSNPSLLLFICFITIIIIICSYILIGKALD